MMLAIIRIGKSKGTCLPKAVLEQCGFGDEVAVELEVRAEEIILRKAKRPREGWSDAFCTALEKHGPEAEMLVGNFPNEFDETEWTWPKRG